MLSKIRILPQNSQLCGNAFLGNKEQSEKSSYILSWSKLRNTVWSVYKDTGWRTHFLHMAGNYRLNVHTSSSKPFYKDFQYLKAKCGNLSFL